MLQNLKHLRKEAGISQQKLADAIRVSQPSINKYENHNIEPDIDILIRMADYFHTTVDYLVGRTQERNPSPAIPMKENERKILFEYRRLSEEQQKVVDLLLESYQK